MQVDFSILPTGRKTAPVFHQSLVRGSTAADRRADQTELHLRKCIGTISSLNEQIAKLKAYCKTLEDEVERLRTEPARAPEAENPIAEDVVRPRKRRRKNKVESQPAVENSADSFDAKLLQDENVVEISADN